MYFVLSRFHCAIFDFNIEDRRLNKNPLRHRVIPPPPSPWATTRHAMQFPVPMKLYSVWIWISDTRFGWTSGSIITIKKGLGWYPPHHCRRYSPRNAWDTGRGSHTTNALHIWETADDPKHRLNWRFASTHHQTTPQSWITTSGGPEHCELHLFSAGLLFHVIVSTQI